MNFPKMWAGVLLLTLCLLPAAVVTASDLDPLVIEPGPKKKVVAPPAARPTATNADLSGSVNGQTTLRRYQLKLQLVSEGQVQTLDEERLHRILFEAFGNAALVANRVGITDPEVEESWETTQKVADSPYYRKDLPGTPRVGHSLPPTDRLVLTATVGGSIHDRGINGEALGVNAQYRYARQTLDLRLEGRVVAIDTGMLRYALTPVKVSKQRSLGGRVEGDLGGRSGALLGLFRSIPGGELDYSSSELWVDIVNAAANQAALQLVRQLEQSPALQLPTATRRSTSAAAPRRPSAPRPAELEDTPSEDEGTAPEAEEDAEATRLQAMPPIFVSSFYEGSTVMQLDGRAVESLRIGDKLRIGLARHGKGGKLIPAGTAAGKVTQFGEDGGVQAELDLYLEPGLTCLSQAVSKK